MLLHMVRPSCCAGGYLRFDERATPSNAVQRVFLNREAFVARPEGHEVPALPPACRSFGGIYKGLAIDAEDTATAQHSTFGPLKLEWINPFTFYFRVR